MSARRFEAVLFDFGGVMIASPFERLVQLAAELGIADVTAFMDLVFGPYHDDTDHPWHRLERGELAFFDYFDDLTARADAHGIALDLGQFATAFGQLPVLEHMVELVVEVKDAGYRTALVTNNIPEGREQWKAVVPAGSIDVFIDSSAEGMRKPDARIYRLALERLGGVEPDRAVFVDDAPGNIAGAAAVGLTTVHVTGDGREAEAQLRTILGLSTA